MKRCFTLGISLCLLALLSGCCCNRRCGGGCSTGYAPACSPCGQQPFGGFAPLGGGGCSSCGPGGGAFGGAGYGGAPVYGQPGPAGIPATYVDPAYGYGSASATPGAPVDTVGLPPASGMPSTAYVQSSPYVQSASVPTTYGQPTLGQPVVMGQSGSFNQSPVTTALVKPESLATY